MSIVITVVWSGILEKRIFVLTSLLVGQSLQWLHIRRCLSLTYSLAEEPWEHSGMELAGITWCCLVYEERSLNGPLNTL